MPAEVGPARTARLWVPHQHGAWAMLALPLLVGVAASRSVPGQLLLGAAAAAVYLASATLQAWLRSRRRPSYVRSIITYAVAAALFGIPLVLLEPRLILAALVAAPAGALTLAASRPGRPRELALSLAHVAQASVLAPAAMLLGGETRIWVLGAATTIVAAEMAGSVLVVRSVIRERDNVGFAARSVAYHVVITLAAAIALPWAYAALAAFLTARAAALPLARRRLAGTRWGLRPVHVGVVEAVASIALVVVAVAIPLAANHP
jgi:YwiC-like protein